MDQRLRSRRTFLKTLGLGAIAISCGKRINDTESQIRPNVILFYVDDLSPFQLGCYGGTSLTPRIDCAASEGIRFTRYYHSCSVCTPSRFSTLTGQYASRSLSLQENYPPGGPVRISWNTNLKEEEFTIAEVLKRGNYITGIVGKWHLGGDFAADIVPSDKLEPDSESARKLYKAYDELCSHIRKVGGFDFADGIYARNVQGMKLPESFKIHNQEWQTKNAFDFIEQNQDRPFFLYWATTIPHSPNPVASIQADPRIVPWGYLDRAPDVQPSRASVIKRAHEAGLIEIGDDGNIKEKVSYSLGMLWLDDAFGAMLDKLDELGIAENTLIILASDNGRTGKNSCYDAGTRIPCIVYWKGVVPGGRVLDDLISNVDIGATIFNACGVTPPREMKLDGASFLSLLKNSQVEGRKSVFLEIGCTRAVVAGDWKYLAIRYPEDVMTEITETNRKEISHDGTRDVDHRYQAHEQYPAYFDYDQLYNLKEDPGEQRNLAQVEKCKGKLQEMKALLTEYSNDLPHSFGEFKS